LVGTIMGFRAFGRAGSALGEPPAPPKRSLLGFAALNPEAPRRESVRPKRLAPASARTGAERDAPVTRPPPEARTEPLGPSRWFYAMSGAICLLGASVIGIVFAEHGQSVPAAVVAASALSDRSLDAAPSAAPATQPVAGSPELRALVEAQIRLMSECRGDPTRCGGYAVFSRAALEPIDAASFAFSPQPRGPSPAWLQRLRVPDEVRAAGDDPSLRNAFDYRTRNIAGRADFQRMYYRCSAYEDIIDASLARYGAPAWLKAVVYQESGCDPMATSNVGAKGLWQFMPEAARAYGLRVLEDDIDQRLDPVRASDAAVHFLIDLRQELGAWDLALAAYNMGPFGVSALVAQAGGRATFGDLSGAGLLPHETAAYVPAIEAYALILENLRTVRLGGGGGHPQSLAEITVRPGTRLSLIARAAHTSTLHIREINRAFLRDTVPEGETTAWVPDSEAHRAQVFFEGPSDGDRADTCVPEDFDWGTTVLETSKFAKKCASGRP
jgi:hypothetical protein